MFQAVEIRKEFLIWLHSCLVGFFLSLAFSEIEELGQGWKEELERQASILRWYRQS